MATHHCSKCGLDFKVSTKNRLVNQLSYIVYPFRSAETSMEKFSWVRCPRCGQEERDDSIRFLGLFQPKVAFITLIIVFLLIAVVDAIIERQ
jgi:DNA-directed RNA polymerase subunit RPC12/RpoP